MKTLKYILLLFPLLMLCQNNNLKIGDFHNGGIIFNLSKDSNGIQHGLIVSLRDIAKQVCWSNVTMELVNEKLNHEIEGTLNTDAIIIQKNHVISAASLCKDYNFNNQTGWYLPSKEEFSKLYANKEIVNKSLNSKKNAVIIDRLIYWTSNEYTSDFAWVWAFYDGSTNSYEVDKTNYFAVRAIKKF